MIKHTSEINIFTVGIPMYNYYNVLSKTDGFFQRKINFTIQTQDNEKTFMFNLQGLMYGKWV